jgi:putative phosphoesterase
MDWSDSLEDELCFPVLGHRIYVAHGHRHGVHGGTKRLVKRARELGADIAVYGHIHVPDYGEEDGVLVINPGSVAKPRQEGWRKSYAVMTIDEDGKVKVKFKYLPKRPFF